MAPRGWFPGGSKKWPNTAGQYSIIVVENWKMFQNLAWYEFERVHERQGAGWARRLGLSRVGQVHETVADHEGFRPAKDHRSGRGMGQSHQHHGQRGKGWIRPDRYGRDWPAISFLVSPVYLALVTLMFCWVFLPFVFRRFRHFAVQGQSRLRTDLGGGGILPETVRSRGAGRLGAAGSTVGSVSWIIRSVRLGDVNCRF